MIDKKKLQNLQKKPADPNMTLNIKNDEIEELIVTYSKENSADNLNKLLCHCVGGHEACVVPCSVKFGARVAEEYDKPCYTLCAAKSIKHGSTSNNYIRSARAKALALNLIIQTDWRWTFPRKHAGSPRRTRVLRTYI